MLTYRTPRPDEARAFFEMLRALDDETRFMMLEPGERRFDEGALRARLEAPRLTIC